MKKQSIALFLSLCWVFSMFLFFSFPAKADLSQTHSTEKTLVKEIGTGELHLRTSSETPKTPPFEVDGSQSIKLNPAWIPAFLQVAHIYLAPAFFSKSVPLINIRTFFIQFYYTW